MLSLEEVEELIFRVRVDHLMDGLWLLKQSRDILLHLIEICFFGFPVFVFNDRKKLIGSILVTHALRLDELVKLEQPSLALA